MEQIEQRNKMAAKPVFPLLMSMAFPPMLSMLVQSMYNIVDSMFVARFSQDALTAVSLAFPLQNLVLAVAVGTGVGVNSYISRKLGAQDQDAANAAVTHGFLLSFAHAVFFVIFGLVAIRQFFRLFTDSAEIFSLACDYSYIVVLGAFAQLFHIMVEKLLQATGRMLAPMLLQAIGAIANIILDPILIFGLFGAPRMGVRGAAVATVLGQVLSMTLSLLVFFLRDQDVRMDLKKFKPDLHAVAQIYAVGVPTMLMNALGSVLVTLLNSILIRFSELAVSVFGVYFKLQTFVFMPVSGLTQGALPIMGYNYGAQNQKRLLATLRCAVLVAVGIMAAGNLLFALMPDKLLLLFDASPDMLGIGVPALRIISCSYVFAAIGLILSNLFQAVGKGAYSLTVFLMRQLIVVVPLAFLLSQTMGLNGIWVAFPIAEAAGAVAAALFFLIFRRKDAIFHQAAVPQPEAGD